MRIALFVILTALTISLSASVRADDEHADAVEQRFSQLAPLFIAAYHEGKFADTIDLCTQAIALHECSELYIMRGTAHLELGQLDEAIADGTSAIHLETKADEKANWYAFRSEALRKKGDIAGALADVCDGLDLAPTSKVLLLSRSTIWISREEYKLALADLNQLISNRAKVSGCFILRSQCYCGLGDFQSALKDADQAVLMKEADAYTVRATIRESMGDYKAALADYEKGLSGQPNSQNANVGLLKFLATCPDENYRDRDRAKDIAMEMCARTKWKECPPLMLLAGVYSEIGDFSTAIKWQKEAIEAAGPQDRERAEKRLDMYLAKQPAYSSR